MRATPAGSALAHHARVVTLQLERMRGELSEYAKGLRGHIHLLANTTATEEFLPATLGRFLSAHPNVDINLEERSSREIVRAIAANLADIGVAGDEAVPAAEVETFHSRSITSSLSHRISTRCTGVERPRFVRLSITIMSGSWLAMHFKRF